MAAFELRKVPARILECFGRQVQRSAGIIAGGIGMAGSLHEQLGIAIRRDSIDKHTPGREEMVVRFLFVFVRSRCQKGPVQVFIVPLISRKGCKMVEYLCFVSFGFLQLRHRTFGQLGLGVVIVDREFLEFDRVVNRAVPEVTFDACHLDTCDEGFDIHRGFINRVRMVCMLGRQSQSLGFAV